MIYRNLRLGSLLLGCILPVLASNTLSANAQTTTSSPMVIPISSKVYGLTYGDLAAKWWQWLLSIPKDSSPAADDTGKNCGLGQHGPVWFLAGTFGGSAFRTCTIPAGKAIFFPFLGAECSLIEYPNLKTESDLRGCAKTAADAISNLQLVVDGRAFADLQKYRIQSPLFNLTLPPANDYGVAAGQTQSVADGYYVLLGTLPRGAHDIHFAASVVGFTTTNIPTYNFATEATYHLIIT